MSEQLRTKVDPAIMFEVGVFQGATAPVIVHALGPE